MVRNNATIGYFRVDGALFDLFQLLGVLNRSGNILSLLLESCDKDVNRDLKAGIRIHSDSSGKLFLLRLRIPHMCPIISGE